MPKEAQPEFMNSEFASLMKMLSAKMDGEGGDEDFGDFDFAELKEMLREEGHEDL